MGLCMSRWLGPLRTLFQNVTIDQGSLGVKKNIRCRENSRITNPTSSDVMTTFVTVSTCMHVYKDRIMYE